MMPVERNERGMLTTELAVIMPVMFMIALLGIFVVQTERHDARTQQAADAAARAASFARSSDDGLAAAQLAAERVCNGPVVINPSGWSFTAPALNSFTPGHVRLTLSCSEAFTTFGPLLGDTSRTEYAAAVAVIEYWRDS